MKKLWISILFGLSVNAVAAADCSPAKPESFASFFERFSSDQKYSTARTAFPLQILKWEYGLDEKGADASAPVRSIISKRNFEPWTPIKRYAKEQNLEYAVESQNATVAIVKLFEPNSDRLMLYRFKSRRGCWYFWQFEDQSV